MDNYIVSARKYRPSTFQSVVGQKALTTTLKNAIQSNKLAHAYLFCGPRGVGKTSCARIFAKTINCLTPTSNGEACNECESCKAFNEQRSYNIHELDAASNNSVEDIRSLIEQVRVPPSIGKYKVFIIDEVHMLSAAAFNAFLKTLEEPPHYALFILATTEKQKVLPTILSRCQIYDFSRITIDDMVHHLQYVASCENVKTEETALNVIAQKADGGMRDALSIFDQAVSFTGGNITYQSVIDNLNVLDYEYYFRITEAILRGQVRPSLLILNEILEKGFDGQNFITGLASHFRDLLVCKDEATLVLFEVASVIRDRYKVLAKECPDRFLFKSIEICNTCDLSYRASMNKRLLLELTLIQLCQLMMAPSPEPTPVPTGTPSAPAPQAPQSSVKVSSAPQAQAPIQPSAATPTAKAEAPQPVAEPTKRAFRAPQTTSLKDLVNAAKEGGNETFSHSIHTEEEDFTQEQLEDAWLKLIPKYENDNFFMDILSNYKPVKVGPASLSITIVNSAQKEDLMNHLSDIMPMMKSLLRNSKLQLAVHLQSTEKAAVATTASEKYQHLLATNPMLNKLKDEFDLRLD